MSQTARIQTHGSFHAKLPLAPYPGLRPFDQSEWPVFFGREVMTDEVIGRLIADHFVVVHGDSGSGKSSLIRAGVLPRLEMEHARSGMRWRTITMLPRSAPLMNLSRALATLDQRQDEEDWIFEIRRRLNRGRDAGPALAEFFHGEDESICILVDQFEELFSFAKNRDANEAQLFVDILVGLHDQPSQGLYAILTMRSEFLGACARYAGFAEAVNKTQYLLPQMERVALLRAIREPAPLYGGGVTTEFADRLITDVAGGQDHLPMIQHGLMLLWRQANRAVPAKRTAFRLEIEDYRLAGGLVALLSAHADEVMAIAAPDPRRKNIVEHVFRALTDINADGQAFRRPQTFAELIAVTGSDDRTLRDILDRFRADGVSFLSPYGDAPIGPDTLVDISHEALIRSWRKLADEKKGWLQREFEDGLVWKSLRMQAQKGETLSAAATDDRDAWLQTLPSEDWCKRYGGGWSAVQKLMAASREARDRYVQLEVSEARRREAEQHAQRAEEAREAAAALAAKEQELRDEEERRQREAQQAKQREAEARAQRAEEAHRAAVKLAAKEQELRVAQARRTRFAVAAALVGLILTVLATAGFEYALYQKKLADAAVIETKAASLWSGLQPWSDPLGPQDVETLWDLAQADDTVRVAFVRQLANNPALLAQFGFKPAPVARAVGLRWPDEALEIIKQFAAHVASDEFDPKGAQPFELISYAKGLAVLSQLVELDQGMLDTGRETIDSAIKYFAATSMPSDLQLRVLAELVGMGFDSESIGAAREKLSAIIGSATAEPDRSGWNGLALSRAIEAVAPYLQPEEQSGAIRVLISRLDSSADSWLAKAAPRAMIALLPTLNADRAAEMLSAVPPAIGTSALAAATNQDSSYLLALMQVAEKVASMGDQAAAEALGQALVKQFAAANQPLQRAALARAAIPLLPQLPAAPINRRVADIIAPKVAALDPAQRAWLRQRVLEGTADALSQAVSSPDPEQRARQSEAVLQMLHASWSTETSPTAGADAYRLAAQARLVALLAPSLTPDSSVLVTEDLLAVLPRTQDYLAREAIARALGALAPDLTDGEREAALTASKGALATTGSTEEATAWARAIAALLPDDPREATGQIVEVLKYPTATGAPTDILLEALKKPWPEDYKIIAGRGLPDEIVLDWLRTRLPEGYSLTDPPTRPPSLQRAEARL